MIREPEFRNRERRQTVHILLLEDDLISVEIVGTYLRRIESPQPQFHTAGAEAEVRELNAGVPCLRAQFGDVDPQSLLQVTPGRHDGPVSRPVHNSAIRSFALRFEQPVRRELLQRFLSTLVELRGADLLRVKGLVPVEDGVVAVQGVRHVFDRLRPTSASQARAEPALVFITNGVEHAEVQALWLAMKALS